MDVDTFFSCRMIIHVKSSKYSAAHTCTTTTTITSVVSSGRNTIWSVSRLSFELVTSWWVVRSIMRGFDSVNTICNRLPIDHSTWPGRWATNHCTISNINAYAKASNHVRTQERQKIQRSARNTRISQVRAKKSTASRLLLLLLRQNVWTVFLYCLCTDL